MAYLIHFRPARMTREQYERIHEELDRIGLGNQPERPFHVGFGLEDHIEVIDIWTSLEAFHSFGEALMPIIEAVGVQIGTPHVHTVQRLQVPGVLTEA